MTLRRQLSLIVPFLLSITATTGPALAQSHSQAKGKSRTIVVAKRTESQEQEFKKLLEELYDANSSLYHKWLTPAEIGERFGASDQEIDDLRSTLNAAGLSISKIHPDRTTFEITGSREQLRALMGSNLTPGANVSQSKVLQRMVVVPMRQRQLKRTSITKKLVFDKQRHAFFRPTTTDTRSAPTSVQPMLSSTVNGTPFYGVTPGDLAVQYALPSYTQGSSTTLKGSGATVGIVSDTNINLSYVNAFGATFGLTMPQISAVVDGQDPETFAGPDPIYFQLETIGAIAPSSRVIVYTSNGEPDGYENGMQSALIRAVADDDVNVLLYPETTCESGTDAGDFYSITLEAAAAEGITVVVPAGNSGSAGCDEAFGSAASQGLAVSALASSPFVTAVGGTDFYYGTQGAATQAIYDQYWSSSTTNYTTQLQPVPEQVWNDSIQSTDQQFGFSYLLAGGGGINTVGYDTNGNALGGPYSQPWWQIGVVPASLSQTARVIPDVSFFAGDYTNNSAYVFCADGTDCSLGSGQNPSNLVFTQGSGTEVSSAVFTGIMALVVGQHGAQGNVNPTLYAMSQNTPGVFNDVVYGTNSVACVDGSPNCANGVLTLSDGATAYDATPGYDAASGLGSINATALVQQWAPPATSPTTTALVTLNASNQTITSFAQGTLVTKKATVTATTGTPTGDVEFLTDSGMNANRTVGLTPLPASSGTTAVVEQSDIVLPGGTYHLYARYAGDATHAPSISSPVTLTVSKAACNFVTFFQSLNSGANISYGTPVTVRMEPFAAPTNDVVTATGAIGVSDNGGYLLSAPLDSAGVGVFAYSRFLPGSHSLTFSYNGDSSIQSCSSSSALAFTVNAIPTTTTVTSSLSTVPSTNGFYALTAVVQPSVVTDDGIAPFGTFKFTRSDGLVVGTVGTTNSYSSGVPTAYGTVFLGTSALGAGNSSITATFTPTSPSGYQSSTSSPIIETVGTATGLTGAHLTISTSDGGNVYYDAMSTLTVNVNVTGNAPTGTVTLFANGSLVGNMTSLGSGRWTYVFDSSTSATGTLPLPVGSVQLVAQYSGDAHNGTDRQPLSFTILDDQAHPDFTIYTPTPYGIVSSGTTTKTFALQLTGLDGFNGTVSLAASAPAGITCTIPSPGTVSLSGTVISTPTLTCSNIPSTKGRYPITVTGSSSISSTTSGINTGIVHLVGLDLTVQ